MDFMQKKKKRQKTHSGKKVGNLLSENEYHLFLLMNPEDSETCKYVMKHKVGDCEWSSKPQHSSCIPWRKQGRVQAGCERAVRLLSMRKWLWQVQKGRRRCGLARTATQRAGGQHKAWSEHRSALLQWLSALGQWRQHSYCGSSS